MRNQFRAEHESRNKCKLVRPMALLSLISLLHNYTTTVEPCSQKRRKLTQTYFFYHDFLLCVLTKRIGLHFTNKLYKLHSVSFCKQDHTLKSIKEWIISANINQLSHEQHLHKSRPSVTTDEPCRLQTFYFYAQPAIP